MNYTKNLYDELVELCVNDLNNLILENYIDIICIKEKDNEINEKKIWIIYNDTINSLEKMNKESKDILKDYYEYLNEDFLVEYSIKNDLNLEIFKDNIDILNNLLKDNYEPFSKKVNDDLNDIYSFLDNQLDDYKKTLNEYFFELNKTIFNENDYYNIEKEKINDTLMHFYKILYLLNEINSTLIIIFLDKINSKIEYIKKKIILENEYYELLLNNTKEMGITSKEALQNLYPLLSLRLNNSIYFIMEKFFEDEIYLFIKENKKIFSDNLIHYLTEQKNNNKSNFGEIFKFNDYLDDFIYNSTFNKSIENISSNLLNNNLLLKIKEIFNNIIEEKASDLNNLLCDLNIKMNATLNNISTIYYSDDMNPIVNKNSIYQKLVYEQTNFFNFIVSSEPFKILDNFTFNYLEPPLDKIKQYYSDIEEELVKELFSIIDNFDNIYGYIAGKLDKDFKIKNIQISHNLTKELIENYTNYLVDEINGIKSKLFNYTYINGLGNKKIRNLDNKFEDKNINMKNDLYYESNNNIKENKEKFINNKTKNRYNYNNNYDFYKKHKKRKIESNNSKEGSYNIFHIIKVFESVNQILSSFCKINLSSQFKKISNNLNIFTIKNEKFLIQLERTIQLSLLKYSSFLTSEKLFSLEKKLYYQYNLINVFVFKYLDDISEKIINFIEYLNSTTVYFDSLFNKLNSTVVEIYDDLTNLINDKYEILNYGSVLRNLEKFKDKLKKNWDFSVTLSINFADELNDKTQKEIKIAGPLAIKVGLDLFAGFVLEFGVEKIFSGDKSIYIDLYAQASISIFGEVGIYFKLGGGNEINMGAGISFNLASVKEGIKYEYKKKEKKDNIEIYKKFEALQLKAYVYIEFKIKIIDIILNIRIELANALFKGYEIELGEINYKKTSILTASIVQYIVVYITSNYNLITTALFALPDYL